MDRHVPGAASAAQAVGETSEPSVGVSIERVLALVRPLHTLLGRLSERSRTGDSLN